MKDKLKRYIKKLQGKLEDQWNKLKDDLFGERYPSDLKLQRIPRRIPHRR